MTYSGVLERYGALLDLPAHTRPVTLLEGNTPLIPLPRLAEELGGGFELYVKFEGLNPTGSFKDRGMTVAISEAPGAGVQAVICASTGNTAASAAAYAARAGMRAIVLIPQGKVAAGKLAGAVAYGAQVIQIDGSFDDALSLVVEITQQAADRPGQFAQPLPPGRAEDGGFRDLRRAGRAPRTGCACRWATPAISPPTGWASASTTPCKRTGLPRILGVQAAGSAPLVLGHPVEHPETVATAIRIGRPARGEQALQAAEESGGRIIAVSDEEILAMQRRLAAEGVWVEPASAAGLAGLAARARSRAAGPARPAGGGGLHRSRPERPGHHHPGYARPAGRPAQSGGVVGGFVRGYRKIEGQFLPQRHGEERYSPLRRREHREKRLTAKKRRAQRFFCEGLLVTVRLP